MDEIKCEVSHFNEIEKCKESFEYFCEKYVKLHDHKSNQMIPFKLYDFQKSYIKQIEENKEFLCVKFRQGGFSSINIAWFLWRFLFKENETNLIASKNMRASIGCHDTFKLMYDCIPWFLKDEVLSHQSSFKTESKKLNNKLFFYDSTRVQGVSIDNLCIEEAAFFDDHTILSIWPCYNKKGNLIITSTPNGMSDSNGFKNWFYSKFEEASSNETSLKAVKFCVTDHPEFSKQEWIDEYKNSLGDRGWRQEYLCEFLENEKNKESKLIDLFTEKPVRGEYHKFEERSIENRQEFLNEYYSKTKPIDHPVFDTFDHLQLERLVNNKKDNFKPDQCFAVEEEMNQLLDFDVFALAGIINPSAESKDDWRYTEEITNDFIKGVFKRIQNKFYGMKLSKSEGRIYLNNLRTNINLDDLTGLYINSLDFLSVEASLDMIEKILIEKISVLFEFGEDL
jgi:hypothetical protein